MRRTIWLLAGVLLCIVALGSDSPKEYDDRMVNNGIEGTWRLTEVEESGRKMKPSYQDVTTYRGGTYSSEYRDGETHRGDYRINPNRKPPHLDHIPLSETFHGVTIKCIYQIDGDTLRIAYLRRPGDSQRPQGFNDDGICVSIFKRVK